MKNIRITGIHLVWTAITAFFLIMIGVTIGCFQIVHSEGWIDHERQTFVLEVGHHYYEWDISEE